MITTTKYGLKKPEANDSADLRIYVGDNMNILDAHTHLWADITDKPPTFTPPIATATILGGVKVGNGLAVDGTGLLSTTNISWGTIIGTLSTQTDLQNALNAKLNLTGGTLTGNLILTNSTFTQQTTGTSHTIYKKTGYKSFNLQHSTTNYLSILPSISVDGTDWDTTKPFQFRSDGTFNAFSILENGTSLVNKYHPKNTTGTASPTSTPTSVGLIYIDTTNKTSWFSTGTTSSADWKRVDNFTTWGSITGTLSTQTDLQTALNGKSNTNHTHAVFNTTADGFVPKTTTSNTVDFLRRDGTWATPPSIAPTWGAIGGTLSNQTDLNTSLSSLDTRIDSLEGTNQYLPTGFVERLGDNVDLNTITSSGIYTVSSSTNAPPISTTNPDDWFYLEVIRHDPAEETNTEWILQKAYDFRGGSFIRRRWYDTTTLTNKWDGWVALEADNKPAIAVQGGGFSVGANAFQRVNFSAVAEKNGITFDDTANLFTVPRDGYYLINSQGYINMSVGIGFYVEIWTIGETMTDPQIISCFAVGNGWNFYTGSRLKWLVRGKQYEFVWKHNDTGYTRTLTELKASIHAI